MKKNIAFFIFFLSFCFPSVAVTSGSEIIAPLGLKWGMTKNKLIEKVGSIKEIESNNGIEQYLVKNTNSKINDLDVYSVGVDNKHGLTNVYMVFNIKNDESGTKSIEKYNILKKALVSKYGEQYSEEYMWRGYNKDFTSFSDCIINVQCGKYESLFGDDKGGSIQLRLLPDSSGEFFNIFLLYKSPAIKLIKEEMENNYNSEVQKKAQALSDSL